MSPRGRMLAIIAIPILVSGIVTTSTVYSHARTELIGRADHFGETIATQLAVAVTDPVIQQDLLSLNVIVNELSTTRDFGVVSIYSADNRLLAQAGKGRADLRLFTKDIVFQDSTTGYVQLGLEPLLVSSPLNGVIAISLALHAVILFAVCTLVWRYSDLVYIWLAHTGTPDPKRTSKADTEKSLPVEPEHVIHTLLVIKVRPLRRLEANRSKLIAAMGLYRGDVDPADGDDIVVTYKTADQLLQAMLSASLVQSIMEPLRGQVKCGIHTISSSADRDLVAKAKKHATHLASISDDKILMSRQVYEETAALSQVTIEEYHSSLTPDGEVYYLASLSETNRDLIQRQAQQFT